MGTGGMRYMQPQPKRQVHTLLFRVLVDPVSAQRIAPVAAAPVAAAPAALVRRNGTHPTFHVLSLIPRLSTA